MSFYIINKSDSVQRTSVKGNKQDIKPGEIVEVSETESIYITKAYWDIFWISEEANKRVAKKETKDKIKKKIFKD